MRVWPILVGLPTGAAIAAHLLIVTADDGPTLAKNPVASPVPTPDPASDPASGAAAEVAADAPGQSDGLAAFALQDGAGATLFAQHCAACHGWRGEGGPMAPALAPAPSPERIRAAIRMGVPARDAGYGPMPPVDALSDDDIDRLIRHLGALLASAR
jgi:mono/diheme cytochrome c family protein